MKNYEIFSYICDMYYTVSYPEEVAVVFDVLCEVENEPDMVVVHETIKCGALPHLRQLAKMQRELAFKYVQKQGVTSCAVEFVNAYPSRIRTSKTYRFIQREVFEDGKPIQRKFYREVNELEKGTGK